VEHRLADWRLDIAPTREAPISQGPGVPAIMRLDVPPKADQAIGVGSAINIGLARSFSNRHHNPGTDGATRQPQHNRP
jgi:hypothetical protein